MNMTGSIGRVVSSKLATLYELQTVYGARDLYDLMEIAAVDAYNENIANKD